MLAQIYLTHTFTIAGIICFGWMNIQVGTSPWEAARGASASDGRRAIA
jgi:hypothetical protein